MASNAHEDKRNGCAPWIGKSEGKASLLEIDVDEKVIVNWS